MRSGMPIRSAVGKFLPRPGITVVKQYFDAGRLELAIELLGLAMDVVVVGADLDQMHAEGCHLLRPHDPLIRRVDPMP